MEIKKVDLKDKVFTLAYDDCAYDFYDEAFDQVTFISNHRDYTSKGELSHLELDNVIDAYVLAQIARHIGEELPLTKFQLEVIKTIQKAGD